MRPDQGLCAQGDSALASVSESRPMAQSWMCQCEHPTTLRVDCCGAACSACSACRRPTARRPVESPAGEIAGVDQIAATSASLVFVCWLVIGRPRQESGTATVRAHGGPDHLAVAGRRASPRRAQGLDDAQAPAVVVVADIATDVRKLVTAVAD